MKAAAVLSSIHSHLLGIALVAAGIAVHTVEPYVKGSVKTVTAHPNVLAVRASYNFVMGDFDSALQLAEQAAGPTYKPSTPTHRCHRS
ncbi:MAG: hypothetical protein JWO20_2044 [Candidatus Angelobacter sp.]|jgi:hypothetical protein|nr:hypothetical protein [Candidatus Angelobacter sp.]